MSQRGLFALRGNHASILSFNQQLKELAAKQKEIELEMLAEYKANDGTPDYRYEIVSMIDKPFVSAAVRLHDPIMIIRHLDNSQELLDLASHYGMASQQRHESVSSCLYYWLNDKIYVEGGGWVLLSDECKSGLPCTFLEWEEIKRGWIANKFLNKGC